MFTPERIDESAFCETQNAEAFVLELGKDCYFLPRVEQSTRQI